MKPKKETNTVKDTIKKAVIKIKKDYPHLNKKIIEMYVSSLVPELALDGNYLSIENFQSNLENYISNYNIGSSIREYVASVNSFLADCPCDN